MRVSGNVAGVLALFLALSAAFHAVAAETRVLSAVPMVHRVDVEAGVMLHQRGLHLCANDLETGAARWSCPLPQNNHQSVMSTGLHHSVIFTDTGQVTVIDHQTGEETLRLNVAGGRGKLNYASLENEDQWLVLYFEKSAVLCEMATRRQFLLPMPSDKVVGARWMEDGKTFLITEVLGGDTPPTRAQVWFWEPGVSKPVAGGLLEYQAQTYFAGILPEGQMVFRGFEASSKDKCREKIYDPATGNFVRETERPIDIRIWTSENKDCSKWHEFDETGNILHVHSLLSGETLLSLKLPGEKTARVLLQPRDAGKDWVLVCEENGNLWLVPLEKDGVPRQILDKNRFLPRRVYRILPPHILCFQNTEDSNAQSLALFTIEGLKRKRTWDFANSQGGFGQTALSDDTSRLSVCTYRWENNVHTSKTLLMEDGQSEPLLEMEGEILALSPDGRHVLCVIGDKKDQALLVNVEKREPIMAFTAEQNYGIGAMVFSPTCRRAAVFHYPDLTVVDMAEGLPRRDMSFPASDQNPYISRSYDFPDRNATLCFSLDETMLLAAGYGKAWLFKADTGQCLQTFVEENRFAAEYQPRQQGFLSTLEGMASDYMGKVTDRFKNRARLTCAFALDGLRAVTIAQNQLVRVWDVQTGQETGMIKTGLPETRNKQGSISNQCVLSANGAYLFSYNCDGYGKGTLWETASGRKLREYPCPEGANQAAVENDGRTVYLVIMGDLHILPGRE